MSRSILAAVAVAAFSVATVAKADLKIGYVDLQRALMEVDEGRAAKNRLQSMMEAKQKEIDREQEALRKESELLEKQRMAMSEDTLRQKQIEMQKKLMELQQKWQKSSAEMDQKQRTELSSIFAKMDPIIAEIAEREGMTMVFDKADSGLVFAPPSLDITNDLVRAYNNKHKGTGGSKKTEAPKGDAPKAADAPKK